MKDGSETVHFNVVFIVLLKLNDVNTSALAPIQRPQMLFITGFVKHSKSLLSIVHTSYISLLFSVVQVCPVLASVSSPWQ